MRRGRGEIWRGSRDEIGMGVGVGMGMRWG